MGTSRPTCGLRNWPILTDLLRSLLHSASASARTLASRKNFSQSFGGSPRGFVPPASLFFIVTLPGQVRPLAIDHRLREGGQLVQGAVERGRRLAHVLQELGQ